MHEQQKEKWNDDAANLMWAKSTSKLFCADNRRRSLKLYRKNNGNEQKRTQWAVRDARWSVPEKNIFVQIYRQWKIDSAWSPEPLDCRLLGAARDLFISSGHTTNSLFVSTSSSCLFALSLPLCLWCGLFWTGWCGFRVSSTTTLHRARIR